MDKIRNDPQLIDRLARAAHGIFCDEMIARGFKYGAQTSESDKTHSSLKSYSDLPEDEKEQNRDTVRDIPDKLAFLGYSLQLKRREAAVFEFSNYEIEILAEKEHFRWVKQKRKNGWRFGSPTDKAKKLHQDLVPWTQLDESAKEKDRLMIRAIPQIVDQAGYIIVKANSQGA
jgi:hypothetical protein